jgi:hypothetical protein
MEPQNSPAQRARWAEELRWGAVVTQPEEKGATVVDQRHDGSSSLLGDQVKSDPRHPVWCSTEQVARLWEMQHAREETELPQWLDGAPRLPSPDELDGLGSLRAVVTQAEENGCDGGGGRNGG